MDGPPDDLDKRFGAVLRARAVEEAISASKEAAASTAARAEYARDLSPLALISEPLYVALKRLREESLRFVSESGHKPMTVVNKNVSAASATSLPLFEDSLQAVESAVEKQVFALYKSFSSQNQILKRELDATRAEIDALRSEGKRFDEATISSPRITHPYATPIPQFPRCTCGAQTSGNGCVPSTNADGRAPNYNNNNRQRGAKRLSLVQQQAAVARPRGASLISMISTDETRAICSSVGGNDAPLDRDRNVATLPPHRVGGATLTEREGAGSTSPRVPPVGSESAGLLAPSYANSVKDSLAMQLHMITECVALQVSAQHVRLFLFDSQRNLSLAADFPRDYKTAPTFDDSRTGLRRWGRSLRTVSERNVTIIGHTLSNRELVQRMENGRGQLSSSARGHSSPKRLRSAKGTANERERASDAQKEDEDISDGPPLHNANKIKCYMCWPIRSYGAPSVVRGAIEVVNKCPTQTSKRLGQFTAADESAVYHATLTISALLARYPIGDDAVLEASKSHVPRVLASVQKSNGIPPSHLPEVPYVDKGCGVRSAENIVNKALATPLSLPVFRGVMHSIRTHPGTIESVSSLATAGLDPASTVRPANITHLPASDTAVVDYRYETPSQLTQLDYTLDALSTMWRQEYEENRAMHEQVRYWSGRVRALSDLTRCFNEAVAKARAMRTVEEIQTYLRSLDLSVRTNNVPAFLATVMEGVAEGGTKSKSQPLTTTSSDRDRVNNTPPKSTTNADFPETTSVLRHRRIEIVDEGPSNVRTFTLDPDAKRKQQADIERFIKEHTTFGDAVRSCEQEEAAGARYTRGTALSSSREAPRRLSWQIEQRHEAFQEKRRVEREGRVGVPRIEETAAKLPSSIKRANQGGIPANVIGPSPLVLPEGRLFLPAPPRSPRK